MTSKDKFDIDFIKFLLRAYANYPLAAFFNFITYYVSRILDFSMFIIEEY